MLKSRITDADDAYYRLFTIKVARWAELSFRIRQVPGSNLDPETGYLGWLFFRDWPQSLEEIPRQRPKLRHGHFLPIFLFTTRPAIEQHTVLATTRPSSKQLINKQKEMFLLLTTLDHKLGTTIAQTPARQHRDTAFEWSQKWTHVFGNGR
jgi:hypothetical protein